MVEAGKSYTVVLGVEPLFAGSFVATATKACSAQKLKSSESYYEAISEGPINYAGTSSGYASGFIKKHTFAKETGRTMFMTHVAP